MTQAEVANLSNRAIISFLLGSVIVENEYIVDFYVCVDDAPLVHVSDAVQDIHRPDLQFLVFDRLILSKYSFAEIV